MASIPTDDLVRTFAAPKLRFESPIDDPRMFEGTAEALRGVGPVEYPTSSTPRETVVDWWKAMGPAFAGVMAGWAGEVPEEISSTVSKVDVDCDGTPVRILKHVDVKEAEVPIVVYLHGGGFTAWSYTDGAYDAYLTRLASLGKCVLVAVDFRAAQDAPFPAGLDDCYKVTKWVVGGDAPNIPSGPVVLAGDSAGANLAFGTTLQAKLKNENLVKGLYYICPYFDGVVQSENYPSTFEFNGYFASTGFLQAVCTNVCTDEDKETWFKSPLLWPLLATKTDLIDFPPSRTIVMQLDMIRDLGLAMHYKLKEAGIDTTFSIVSGGVHEQQLFTSHSPQVTDMSIKDLAGFAEYIHKK